MSKHRQFLPVFIIIAVTMMNPVEPLAAEDSSKIGRWCDVVGTAWVQEIVIRKTSSGFVASLSYAGSSTQTDQKLNAHGNLYRVQNNPDKEAYKIRGDGNLELLDKEGLIRVAKQGHCP